MGRFAPGHFSISPDDHEGREMVTTVRSGHGGEELNVEFSSSKISDLIAKISHSEQKNWWIYHQNKYSGSNSQLQVTKDQRYGIDDDE